MEERIVTIKDVSKKAGVAISTVSRVLNDMDRVSDETRIKVKKAAEELGYVKNSLAASMKTGKSNLIIVVVPDIINEYYSAVIRGVEQVAIENGYFTLVFSTGDLHQKEEELFSGELGRIIDGAIIIPAYNNLQYYKRIPKPVVVVDRFIKDTDMHSVTVDNYRGAYLLTEELIHAGHTNIAMISGKSEFNVGTDRMQGYCDALKDNGLAVYEENIKLGTWFEEYAKQTAGDLLERDDRPTGIIAMNNLLCIGCIEAARERGLIIGEDLSLVGFDDSAVARLMEKDITVVKRATVEMGKIGMKKLLDIIRKNKKPGYPKQVMLDVELVRRNSVKILK